MIDTDGITKKNFSKKLILKKISRPQKSMNNYPAYKKLKLSNIYLSDSLIC